MFIHVTAWFWKFLLQNIVNVQDISNKKEEKKNLKWADVYGYGGLPWPVTGILEELWSASFRTERGLWCRRAWGGRDHLCTCSRYRVFSVGAQDELQVQSNTAACASILGFKSLCFHLFLFWAWIFPLKDFILTSKELYLMRASANDWWMCLFYFLRMMILIRWNECWLSMFNKELCLLLVLHLSWIKWNFLVPQ